MSKRKKSENNLKGTIIDVKDKEQLKITYEINKKNVFMSAIKQFYEKKIQLIIGPIIVLVGFILKQYTSINFFSNVLIATGMFYVIFPYIMLLGNLINVRAQKVNMEICKDGLHISDILTKNNSLSVLDYKDIYDIDCDRYYVRIIPQDKRGAILSSISVPVNHLTNGDIDAFINVLSSIVKKNGGGKEQGDARLTSGRVILSYTLNKDQYKDIYIKEYFKNKIHIFYIVIFAVTSLVAIFVNIVLSIVLAALCLFYMFYPRIGYKLNSKGHIGEVIIRDCEDGYLSIIGDNVKVKVKPDKIKVICNEDYVKYYIPIRKRYFRYINKEYCDEYQLARFLRIIGYKK